MKLAEEDPTISLLPSVMAPPNVTCGGKKEVERQCMSSSGIKDAWRALADTGALWRGALFVSIGMCLTFLAAHSNAPSWQQGGGNMAPRGIGPQSAMDGPNMRGPMGMWGPPRLPEEDWPGPEGPPPPPPGFELQAELNTVIGEALNEYYTGEARYSPETICPECIGNQTQKILGSISGRIASFCGGKPNSTFIAHFCDFYGDYPSIAVLSAISKAGINPIRLAVPRCAAAGVCGPQLNATRDFHVGMLQLDMLSMAMGGQPFRAGMAQSEDCPTFMEAPAAAEQSDAPGEPELEEGKDGCKACIEKGFQVGKQVLKKRLALICADPRAPPPVQAACQFAENYKYLAKTALLLKLKPWDIVILSCTFRGFCRPPPPPSRPPPGEPSRGPADTSDPHPSFPETHVPFPPFFPDFGPDPFGPPPCPPGPPPPLPPPPMICFLTLGLICPPPPPPPCLPFPPPFGPPHSPHPRGHPKPFGPRPRPRPRPRSRPDGPGAEMEPHGWSPDSQAQTNRMVPPHGRPIRPQGPEGPQQLPCPPPPSPPVVCLLTFGLICPPPPAPPPGCPEPGRGPHAGPHSEVRSEASRRDTPEMAADPAQAQEEETRGVPQNGVLIHRGLGERHAHKPRWHKTIGPDQVPEGHLRPWARNPFGPRGPIPDHRESRLASTVFAHGGLPHPFGRQERHPSEPVSGQGEEGVAAQVADSKWDEEGLEFAELDLLAPGVGADFDV